MRIKIQTHLEIVTDPNWEAGNKDATTIRTRLREEQESILVEIDGKTARKPTQLELQIQAHRCISLHEFPLESEEITQDFSTPWTSPEPKNLPHSGKEIEALNHVRWWEHVTKESIQDILMVPEILGVANTRTCCILAILGDRGFIHPGNIQKLPAGLREEVSTVLQILKAPTITHHNKRKICHVTRISRNVATPGNIRKAVEQIREAKKSQGNNKFRETKGLKTLILEIKKQDRQKDLFPTKGAKPGEEPLLKTLYNEMRPDEFRQFTRDLPPSWYYHWGLEPTNREIQDFLPDKEIHSHLDPYEVQFWLPLIPSFYKELKLEKWRRLLHILFTADILPESWISEKSGSELDAAIIRSEEAETISREASALDLVWCSNKAGYQRKLVYAILEQNSKFATTLRKMLASGI